MDSVTKIAITRLRHLNDQGKPGKTSGYSKYNTTFVSSADTELFEALVADGYAVNMPDIDGGGYFPGPILLDSPFYRTARDGYQKAIEAKRMHRESLREQINSLDKEIDACQTILIDLPSYSPSVTTEAK
jgi:hypothetical protein